jgi:hypothetical protein
MTTRSAAAVASAEKGGNFNIDGVFILSFADILKPGRRVAKKKFRRWLQPGRVSVAGMFEPREGSSSFLKKRTKKLLFS